MPSLSDLRRQGSDWRWVMSVHTYARISVDDGTHTSVSIPSQQETMARYAASTLPGHVCQHWADSGVSGSVPLSERPEGGMMYSQLAKGDHLIVAKTDRAFRSVLDGAAVMIDLESRGISLHLLDLGIDTSNAMGRAMAHVAIAFAELERERCGERRRAAAAYRRAKGIPTMARHHSPLGWRIVRIGEHRTFVMNEMEREACESLLALRQRGHILRDIVTRANRDDIPRRGGRVWTRSGVRRAIVAAREGFPLISEDCRRWGSESRLE